MKNRNLILAVLFLFVTVLFTQCKKEEEQPPSNTTILPNKFKVDIPESISKIENQKKSTNGDTLQGNDIYRHLRTFIAVGEGASDIVQNIMTAIAVHNINQAMTVSFQGNDDGRTKNLVVVENSSFDNTSWEFQMTITDAANESNTDGGKAIQVFWNRNPVKGIAILKPINIDVTHNSAYPNAMYRIDYSEAGEFGYQAHMIVSIAGLPIANPLTDPYSMSTLKMFAGKSGDIVDVYGNSNHPNAKFFTNESGFNWAFVASGLSSANIGIAEVGLPASILNETNRTVLLKDYSIKNVFTNQIYATWPNIDSTSVANYLHNTEAPGYFDASGFIKGGTAPNNNYTSIQSRMDALTPYNPVNISALSITFKN